MTVLFHLGEMATSTQSLDEAAASRSSAKSWASSSVVSPEDEDKNCLKASALVWKPNLRLKAKTSLKARPSYHHHGSR